MITPAPTLQEPFEGLGGAANWRLQFADADGLPLNMLSFEQIDFGAISYKEIFQNVKTILSTPLFSVALERTLGIDQTIVDLPIGQAAQATVAIIEALYFWEPRVDVTNIFFTADAVNGHLIPHLQLKVKNVIYGTDTPYEQTNIYYKPQQEMPVSGEPVPGPPGPPGPQGPRGSLWFVGTTDPSGTTPPAIGVGFAPALQSGDMYLNTTTGDVWQWSASGSIGTGSLGRGTWKRIKQQGGNGHGNGNGS